MSKLPLFAGLLVAGALIVPAFAQTAASLTPQQTIAARQAAFDLSATAFVSMLHDTKDGGDAKKEANSAEGLARWAKILPALFPAGTGAGQAGVDTKARAEIWSDRAGFEKAAANYVAQTQKLSELANAGDTPGFTAQLGDVKKACGACHDNYKAR
jgi:cytochrome c556